MIEKGRYNVILGIERYIPIMTKEEQLYYYNIIIGKSLPNHSNADILRWEGLLAEYIRLKNSFIAKAIKDSVRGL